MSVYNSIYAEVKVGDKWFSLNPIVKNYKGEYVSTALLLGQSWLNDTVNTLRDYASSSGLPEDASEETLKHFSPPDKELNDWGNIKTWGEYYKHCVWVANYDYAVKSRIKKERPYKYMGYVNKYAIAGFEVGENDIEYWLTKDEYDKLDEERKKEYAWYEWNNYYDEYGSLFEIYQMIENLLSWFREAGFDYKSGYNIEDATSGNVRLIIYRD